MYEEGHINNIRNFIPMEIQYIISQDYFNGYFSEFIAFLTMLEQGNDPGSAYKLVRKVIPMDYKHTEVVDTAIREYYRVKG